MGDLSKRLVDDQPHRHGRGRGIPQPDDGQDLEGHSIPAPDERPAMGPEQAIPSRGLPDSDEDDVEGHMVWIGKNANK